MTTTLTRRPTDARLAGLAAIAGAAVMAIGAVLWLISGTDLDAALSDGTMAAYLADTAEHGTVVTAGLSAWILGVLLMGVGGVLLARLGNRDSAAAAIARYCFTAGPAAAIVFFSVWLGIVLGLAPAHVAGEQVIGVAVALGQAATIADWVATALIVGFGAAAVSYAGRGTWVPNWLFNWGLLAAAAGVVQLVAMIADARSTPAGFAIVPIGLGWMIAAGITAVRRGS